MMLFYVLLVELARVGMCVYLLLYGVGCRCDALCRASPCAQMAAAHCLWCFVMVVAGRQSAHIYTTTCMNTHMRAPTWYGGRGAKDARPRLLRIELCVMC